MASRFRPGSQPIPGAVLECLMRGVVQDDPADRLRSTSQIDPEVRASVLIVDGRPFRATLQTNLAISASSNRLLSWVVGRSDRRRLLVPHQFSGLVTTPCDAPGGQGKPFWDRLFDAFFNFIRFPIDLVEKTLNCFVSTVTGDGSPASVARAWVSQSDLDIRKRELDEDAHPCTPIEVLPLAATSALATSALKTLAYEETGLGILGYASESRNETQYADDADRSISRTINAPYDWQCSGGWQIEPEIDSICFVWFSRDRGSNDGVMIGSFLLFEEQD